MKTVGNYTAQQHRFAAFAVSTALVIPSLLLQSIWPTRFSQGIDLTESFFINLLVSQFAHLSWNHLLLNVAGLYVITWGLAQDWPAKRWGLVTIASLFACPLWLSLVEPIQWYVGLSGILHAQFTALLLVTLFNQGEPVLRRDWALWVLFAGLLAKLALEWLSAGGVNQMIGGPIAYSAHRGGVVGGLALAATVIGLQRFCCASATNQQTGEP